MKYDITPIVQSLIGLLATIITCFVIPYIKSKTTAEQQKTINMWVNLAVTAAQQLFPGGGRGKEKKEYVVQWLADRGITIDADKLDTMIEANVYNVKSAFLPETVSCTTELVVDETNESK